MKTSTKIIIALCVALLLGLFAAGWLSRQAQTPAVTAEFETVDTVTRIVEIKRVSIRFGTALTPPTLIIPPTVDSAFAVFAEGVRDSLAKKLDSLGVEKLIRLDTIVNADTFNLTYSEYSESLAFDVRFADRQVTSFNKMKTVTVYVSNETEFYESPLFIAPVAVAIGVVIGVLLK